MPVLQIQGDGSAAYFDEKQCIETGAALHEQYVGGEPFPHIVMDDFIESDFIRPLVEKFPSRESKEYFDRDQERLKFQFSPWEVSDPAFKNLLTQLNSRAFIRFLEALTGIKGLIPDPHYSGGGLHETLRGGHLSVHADFNINSSLKLERRLNFLLYLNDDWLPEYGGNLELWDKAVKAPVSSIEPVLGRAVVFNTTTDSFHGHPTALTCPETRSRRSIATYYYTAPYEGVASLAKRTTVFKARANTNDKLDWKIGLQHFINDWVPFRLQGFTRKIASRFLS